MPRNLVSEVATWDGVVMLDDIGKAEPHMADAVPAMGVDDVWLNHGIYGEGISIAIVDTGVDNAHVGLDDMDDNQFTFDDMKSLLTTMLSKMLLSVLLVFPENQSIVEPMERT